MIFIFSFLFKKQLKTIQLLLKTICNRKGWSSPKVIFRRGLTIYIANSRSGHLSETLFEPWRFFQEEKFSVAIKLIKVDLVILWELFLIHEGSSWFKDPWCPYVILITPLNLFHKVHTNWYILLLCSNKITKVDLVIFQGPFLIHGGSSWFQGWCP